jgi:uncharacterized cupredoxin-like copper-binding protein
MAGATRNLRHAFTATLAAAWLAAGSAALADASHKHGGAIGEPGVKANATRSVTITIRDNFYEPESIEVKKGETIRFVLKNTTELLHEFNIGTAAMHAEHQTEMAVMAEHGMITATGINREMMKMDHSKMGMPAMTHDDPNAVLIEPGKTAELVWKFTKDTTLEFACNLPGHYEAGMVGQFRFRK